MFQNASIYEECDLGDRDGLAVWWMAMYSYSFRGYYWD